MRRLDGVCQPSAPAASSGHIDDRRYVLVVEDLVATEIDAYGPMTRAAAQRQAERVRADLDVQGVEGVSIAVVPLREPAPPSRQDAARG